MIGILKNKTMAKISNSKWIVFVLLIICLFVACDNKRNFEQEFIEDNFLKIVDTIAYGKGAFISLPNDTIRYSDLSVKLIPKISYNKKIDEFTLSYFEENRALKKIFEDALTKGNYSKFSLDSTFPKQIGKYHIFFNANEEDKTIKYAGRIDIENLKVYKDKAMLVLSESIGHYGVTSLVLLIKEGDCWKVIKREVLFQS